MLKLPGIRDAARTVAGGAPDVSVDDTDLGRAFARRLGIPIKPARPASDVRITPNRRERRAAGRFSSGRFSHYEATRSPHAAQHPDRVARRYAARVALEAAKAAHPAGKGKAA